VTFSSPRISTSPFEIVVLPAAESPTTPRMMGRAIQLLLGVAAEKLTIAPIARSGLPDRHAIASVAPGLNSDRPLRIR
jgi:hypothetical protein